MSLDPQVPVGQSWLKRALTTDFCPSVNPFVYWLKEPVGWFVLATAASAMVGLYLSPIGWMLAGSLTLVILLGTIWPAIAVRLVTCRLQTLVQQVHEGDACNLNLEMKNLGPVPLWGLAVEGFLDRKPDDTTEETIPTVALSYLRPLATSVYRFSIRPNRRGRYPDGAAWLTCSFPFGIWTAKQELRHISPVTVWPKVYPINGQPEFIGQAMSRTGDSTRAGTTGDFTGVREYRRGDSIRQVNWRATARAEVLIVTERGAPRCPFVDVVVDAVLSGSSTELDEQIRIAASLLADLHLATIPLRVYLGSRCYVVRNGKEGFIQMMDALADIPEQGIADLTRSSSASERTRMTISSAGRGKVGVCLSGYSNQARLSNDHLHRVIHLDDDLEMQVAEFWTEVQHACLVA